MLFGVYVRNIWKVVAKLDSSLSGWSDGELRVDGKFIKV